MRHLAARFVRQTVSRSPKEEFDSSNIAASFPTEPIHVVDPLLDLRDLFKDEQKLERNLVARDISTTFPSAAEMRENYLHWWDAYKEHIAASDSENSIRRQLRNNLLNQQSGLLTALRLPNLLDETKPVKAEEQQINLSDAVYEELQNSKQEFRSKSLGHFLSVRRVSWKRSPALLRRALLSEFLDIAKSTLKTIPVCSSYFVRPALVECCNIGLDKYPLISDGIESPLCLIGAELPHFLPLLAQHQINAQLKSEWPITLLATGPTYKFDSANNRTQQSEVAVFLVLAKSESECQMKMYGVRMMVRLFLEDALDIAVVSNAVAPEDLGLWESSATILQGEESAEIARFSQIGEYVSKRARILYSSPKKSDEDAKKKEQKNPYLHMAFTRIDLDALLEVYMSRWNVKIND